MIGLPAGMTREEAYIAGVADGETHILPAGVPHLDAFNQIVAQAAAMSETTGIPITELIDRFFFYANNQPPPVKPLTIVPNETKITALDISDLDD